MCNRMDQLFKNKLGDHRLPPSQEAWSKIESGLSKKNKTVILWRSAAVFVLCGFLTSAWFYWQSTEDHTQQLTTMQDEGIKGSPKIQEPLVDPVEKKENKKQVAIIKKSERIKLKKITSIEDTKEITEATPMLKEIEKELAILETVITTPEAKPEKPIVIEFTLDPVASTTLVAEATEPEKSKGFKKILDKAIDLKNGEGELGSLRDAKNELFAFDFKKDKPKRN